MRFINFLVFTNLRRVYIGGGFPCKSMLRSKIEKLGGRYGRKAIPCPKPPLKAIELRGVALRFVFCMLEEGDLTLSAVGFVKFQNSIGDFRCEWSES